MDKSMEDAFRFISQELNANPGANRAKLIEEACQRFDLDPKKAEFLIKQFIIDKNRAGLPFGEPFTEFY